MHTTRSRDVPCSPTTSAPSPALRRGFSTRQSATDGCFRSTPPRPRRFPVWWRSSPALTCPIGLTQWRVTLGTPTATPRSATLRTESSSTTAFASMATTSPWSWPRIPWPAIAPCARSRSSTRSGRSSTTPRSRSREPSTRFRTSSQTTWWPTPARLPA